MIKILIIEDEEFYAAFLKKIIIKKYHCDHARDGIEAKDLLLKNRYDILIYDLRLPGILGKDLLQYVRKKVDPDIINIVVTGYEEDWPPVEATGEHVFFYLKKGMFRPEELMKVLDNAAELRMLRLKEAEHIRNLIASEKFASTGRLAAGIAHEINNPLQSMFTVTDMIKKKLASDENSSSMKHDVDIIEKGMNRIKTIVKQLIDLHSVDHKLKGINHLDKIVERVVSFIRPIAKERNVRISMRCNLHNVKIFVSESQFFHVLLNLCLSLFDTNNEIIEVETKKQNNFAAIEIRARKRVSTKIDGRPSRYSIQTDSIDLEIPKSIIQHYNGTIEIHENKSDQTINIKLPIMNETRKNRKINI